MNNDILDTRLLEDYLDGKLDAKAMHFVERLSLEDPFVAEALEGLSQAPKRMQTMSLLQKQLHERIQQEPAKRKRWGITVHRLSIAATAAVLFITASIIFWMQRNNQQTQFSEKKVEVALTPQAVTAEDKATPVPETQQLNATLDRKAVEKAKAARLSENNAVRAAAEKARRHEGEMTLAAARTAVAADEKDKPAVTGNVVSLTNGLPISGAEVRDNTNNVIATTDKDGGFKVALDSTENAAALKIDHQGYQGKEIVARINEPVRVALNPAIMSSADIAILANKRKQNLPVNPDAGKIVMPLVGWADFDKYLATENKLRGQKPGQTVELEFAIAKDGTPVKVKVLKGIDAVFDAEAVRLLTTGPKWQGNGTSNRTRYLLKF